MSEPLPRVGLQICQGDQDWGRIVLELDSAHTPKTVANFLRYVESGFFENTVFHRVIANFMIQGGGYLAGDKPKRGELPAVQNEARDGLHNTRGTIAMARTNDPHSATSQFFINVADNDFLDHPGSDGWGYCAFGRVVEGMEVVDKIRQVKTRFNPQMGEDSQPIDPPFIKKAEQIKA